MILKEKRYVKQSGTSNKEYTIKLLKENNNYLVNFHYGKIGQTQKTGTKTKSPVILSKAEHIFNKIEKTRIANGYRETKNGETVMFTPEMPNDEHSTQKPQLLVEVDEKKANELLEDPNYGMQEKIDGERRMVEKTNTKTIGVNKKGKLVNLPKQIDDSIICNTFIDAEIIGNKLYSFDLLGLHSKSYRESSFESRYNTLSNLKVELGDSVNIVDLYKGTEEKKKALQYFMENNKEGVVFKRLDSKYYEGRGDAAFKFKFYKTTTCRVKKHTEGKRSIHLEMIHNGLNINIGKCTIPQNKNIPEIGSFVEVRYLYAYKGGCLFQPVFLGERNDQDESDIKISQLIYKAEDN